MKSKIKFRAWHKEFKVWCRWPTIIDLIRGKEIAVRQPITGGPQADLADMTTCIKYYRNINIFDHPDWEVDQFIGFIDNKKNEIYENDVLRGMGSIKVVQDIRDTMQTNSAAYDNVAYTSKSNSIIIGNLRETPELVRQCT